MSRELPTDAEAQPPRASRAQRVVLAGFLFAFGLTILTLLLTAYYSRLAHREDAATPAPDAATRH